MRFLILDFSRVTGIDLTAATGLRALTKVFEDRGTHVVWSGLDNDIHSELLSDDVETGQTQVDYDHAVSWAEEQLLAGVMSGAWAIPKQPNVPGQAPDLFSRLPSREVAAGDLIIDPSEGGRDLYVLESGYLSAWTTLEDGRKARLRRISPGAMMGEIAFCTGAARTAEVIADTDAVLRVLERSEFEQLVTDRPDEALEIQEFLLRRLSYRLADTSSLARDLMR